MIQPPLVVVKGRSINRYRCYGSRSQVNKRSVTTEIVQDVIRKLVPSGRISLYNATRKVILEGLGNMAITVFSAWSSRMCCIDRVFRTRGRLSWLHLCVECLTVNTVMAFPCNSIQHSPLQSKTFAECSWNRSIVTEYSWPINVVAGFKVMATGQISLLYGVTYMPILFCYLYFVYTPRPFIHRYVYNPSYPTQSSSKKVSRFETSALRVTTADTTRCATRLYEVSSCLIVMPRTAENSRATAKRPTKAG